MRTKPIFIIRVALVSGVAAFAALAAYQHSRMASSDAFDLMRNGGAVPFELFRYVLWALAGAAIAFALVLRPRVEVAAPEKRGPILVIGWAFGEGVALFGAVQHFIGAPLSTMAVGLLTFVVVLLILPIPPERA